MTYSEAVAFWHGRINYEVRAASPADLKLERMRALLRRLGDPHLRLRVVHVAGTKGKGSTCALVEAAARAAGYRVGLFTSPHLEHVEERVQVNRVPVSATELAALLTQIEPHVRALDALGPHAAPTFFEIITAAGFLHFVHHRCELVLLEVGLGGRFDSTNVCAPLVTAITSIGLDHTQQLGDTPELIAYQKAGILKRNVPAVIGALEPGPLKVVEQVAAEVGAVLTRAAGRPTPPVALPGLHQQANAAVALGIVDALRAAGFRLPDAAVNHGFKTLDWPARIEVLRREPAWVILDSAHNMPSIQALVSTIQSLHNQNNCRESRHAIFASSSDKPFANMLICLGTVFGHVHVTRYAANSRAVPPEQLARVNCGARTWVHGDAASAWRAAWAAVPPGGLVCITGSMFLAGELRLTILTQISPPKE